ncbi:Rhamnolipids biosynthesis 3-oxoacyl-[acyl-carrier-protein] reductase [Smittium culicis]|uniref:Rhamnolipids biosynthesis 3-oxoacyl-[acyl-carrier-protein] reductase n=1 Tax=Smittium culicis TaxID=133412 RepID=A0A1R1XE25_9FUNG|nr:Rhamnolipids biosynthesis 3-oxoacyl-[acyl-carrier-protein] reductase [Smittium culicis]OMJ12874.1 Rhamnolipids biosynthesis 3-oxoacyl-[acyl-carrier-protein] reductase [Smittium culicis]OMJ15479.1 Rhamnolipids biosynthesis 3-oxoacyl-[acyl-carrier-protein] reductase [Smittium culicis]
MADIENLVNRLSALEPSGVDILVNNAGATWSSVIDDYPYEGFMKVMNLNLTNIFFLSQKMLPLLLKRASFETPARIINIGSIAGHRVSVQPTYAYNASKAGLHHLTRVMSTHLGVRNITVNAVAPGPFMSKMMAETLAKNKDSIIGNNPMRRIGNPDDMAGVCIYLASKAGAYTNGAVIVVDGGTSIAPKF